MRDIPQEIADALAEHHVLSMALNGNGGPWAASVFYLFDKAQLRLIFLTSFETRHGAMLVAAPEMAGTIAAQPLDIGLIYGLQFTGNAQPLTGTAADEAMAAYIAQFPQAHGMSAPVWAITPTHIKLTDNRRGFGRKTTWDRNFDV
jgi:uncharacterized protein YhbP (UPF0306 family)